MRLFQSVLIIIALSPASKAVITVSSYTTSATTNAFAPLSQAQYFQKQTLENISPATAAVTGNWTGTNIGETADTWHWIGTSNATSSTSADRDSLLIKASGSFAWDISTSSDFLSPNQVTTLYGPGGDASYFCTFTIDSAASFLLAGQLNRLSVARLSRVSSGGFVVNERNTSSIPRLVNTTGTLTPGEYFLNISTGLGGLGFIQGTNHQVESGSFTNFNFTVTVPEPASLGVLGFFGLFPRRRR